MILLELQVTTTKPKPHIYKISSEFSRWHVYQTFYYEIIKILKKKMLMDEHGTITASKHNNEIHLFTQLYT